MLGRWDAKTLGCWDAGTRERVYGGHPRPNRCGLRSVLTLYPTGEEPSLPAFSLASLLVREFPVILGIESDGAVIRHEYLPLSFYVLSSFFLCAFARLRSLSSFLCLFVPFCGYFFVFFVVQLSSRSAPLGSSSSDFGLNSSVSASLRLCVNSCVSGRGV